MEEKFPIDGDTKVESISMTYGGDVIQPVSKLILTAAVLAAAMAVMMLKYARSHSHDLSISSASRSGPSVSTGNVA